MFNEGSVLSLKAFKIHLVLLPDEFTSSTNTHNGNFTKAETSFYVVIWPVTPFNFFLLVLHLQKTLGFVLKEILIT